MTSIPPHLAAALIHVRDGDLDAAADSIALAELANDPRHLTLAARGAIEMRRHDWMAAERYFLAALAMNDDLMLHMNLGMARFELGYYEAARDNFRDVLARDHRIGGAWHKLGACYAMLQDHINALACLDHAVGIDPANPECHHGMSVILSHMGVEDGALWHARRAQELKPNYYDAEAIEAFTLLRMGNWAEGWPKFESRWHIASPVSPWNYRSKPLYEGTLDGLRGKRVVLRSEQGFGDSLQFSRYVPLVAEIASSVTVVTHEKLERIFHALPAKICVHPRDEIPEFDVQTSLMSLPLLFETTPLTVPPPTKYVSARQDLGVRVGLCWQGGRRPEDPPADATDRRRSIPEETFQPIIDAAKPCVVLHLDEMRSLGADDWQDTCDLIGGLDLVITVDTAMCHLSASLGIETWMLSRFDSCHRWGMTSTDTPWYPSMRIFRQPRLGHWPPVIDAVVKALGERN